MKTILVCLLAFPLAACTPPDAPNGDAAAPAAAPETAAECRWSYKEGDTGPDNWWRICPPRYALCKDGKEQSPIDLAGAEPDDLPALEFRYRETVFNVVEMYWGQELQGQVQVVTEPRYLEVGSEKYPLAQFHFHNPCEHCPTPRPERELELHLVHLNNRGEVAAVVGVRFVGGARDGNTAFQAFLDTIPREVGPPPGGVATLDPLDLLPPTPRGYYHYRGSLTTPACTEGVRWYVLKQPITVSDGQIEHFLGRYRNTARRPQNREGRSVSQSRD